MKRMVLLALVLVVGALAAATVAGAKDDGERRVAGGCTGRTTSKLKVSRDDGRLETEFEVDQNRVGQRWRVVLMRNGRMVFRGVRRTAGPSGSFEVRRLLADGAGRDRIVAQARNLRSGERCRAALTA